MTQAGAGGRDTLPERMGRPPGEVGMIEPCMDERPVLIDGVRQLVEGKVVKAGGFDVIGPRSLGRGIVTSAWLGRANISGRQV
jgi:hypothetical protein